MTPVAKDAAEVRRLAAGSRSLDVLTERVSECRACPRLVTWREDVAIEKRAAFRNEVYWGRPVRLPPCAAGASPTMAIWASAGPQPGTGRPQ